MLYDTNILLLTSSFFFFLLSFCCFPFPYFYILDIFITVSCLWFLSIPLWSDNDLLTQTRTIAVSLVKSASSDPQDQYKLVKDISFWNPLQEQNPSHMLMLSHMYRLQGPSVAAVRHGMCTGGLLTYSSACVQGQIELSLTFEDGKIFKVLSF